MTGCKRLPLRPAWLLLSYLRGPLSVWSLGNHPQILPPASASTGRLLSGLDWGVLAELPLATFVGCLLRPIHHLGPVHGSACPQIHSHLYGILSSYSVLQHHLFPLLLKTRSHERSSFPAFPPRHLCCLSLCSSNSPPSSRRRPKSSITLLIETHSSGQRLTR